MPVGQLKPTKADYKQAPQARLIADILSAGLRTRQAAKQAQRLIDKGTLAKQNPYVTDATKCPRATGYSLRNEPRSNSDSIDSLIAFELGTAAEGVLAEALEAAGAVVHRETRIEIPIPGSIVSGRMDFVIEIPGLIDALLELKTTNSRAMKRMIGKGEFGYASHRHQLNLYLHASHLGLVIIDGNPKQWNEGLLVYLVKDSVKGEPSLVVWEQRYDKQMAEADLAELGTIEEAGELGMLPTRPYRKPEWPCNYCAYKSTCWNGE